MSNIKQAKEIVEMATDTEVATKQDILITNDPAVKTALNATGSAPIYACRAWVNFNGVGTVAIRASGNVSSITDNGVGDYTVNFATAMPDANYAYSHSVSNVNTGERAESMTANTQPDYTYSTAALRFYTSYVNNASNIRVDPSIVSIQILR